MSSAQASRPVAATDPGVLLGYPSERGEFAELQLGPGARLCSGTVVYRGSIIGARLHTGHGAVIREQSIIGDDVAIGTNSVVDFCCRIGDRVEIHANCYVAQYTLIDDDAVLGAGVAIANDLYPRVPGSRTFMTGRTSARVRGSV